jgi:hypothetical protein
VTPTGGRGVVELLRYRLSLVEDHDVSVKVLMLMVKLIEMLAPKVRG